MMNGHTQLYGIIGNPVRHSLSPLIHNGVFRRRGFNAVYLAFEVHHLEEAVRGVKGLGIRGLSVTMPFKTAIIPFLDRLEGAALKIRSVNTIAHENGMLIGHNTDGSGAMEALEEKMNIQGKSVILLGAGGAGRAIAFGLKERGCRMTIANRSLEKGRALAEELGVGFVPLPFSAGTGINADVIINATSVGMHPQVEESPLPKEMFHEKMTVMDIVYRPLRTRLLREAEERGCQTIDGLEMLARQGAAQQRIWTGETPESGQIKKDLRQAIKDKFETLNSKL